MAPSLKTLAKRSNLRDVMRANMETLRLSEAQWAWMTKLNDDELERCRQVLSAAQRYGRLEAHAQLDLEVDTHAQLVQSLRDRIAELEGEDAE